MTSPDPFDHYIAAAARQLLDDAARRRQRTVRIVAWTYIAFCLSAAVAIIYLMVAQ